jgi:hypothetical protein
MNFAAEKWLRLGPLLTTSCLVQVTQVSLSNLNRKWLSLGLNNKLFSLSSSLLPTPNYYTNFAAAAAEKDFSIKTAKKKNPVCK